MKRRTYALLLALALSASLLTSCAGGSGGGQQFLPVPWKCLLQSDRGPVQAGRLHPGQLPARRLHFSAARPRRQHLPGGPRRSSDG